MSKGFLAIIAAIIIIFGGLIAFGGSKDNKSSSGGKGGNSSKLSQHIQGSSSSGVTLVEYGDFQCPYCEQYEPTVHAVYEQYKDRIRFQFRNYPLTNLHPNAFAAARAAESAGLQNKFWEMHDTLYAPSNYAIWKDATDPNPYFEQYAKDLKLDGTKFKTDFASSTVNDIINADLAEGTKAGVTGTPAFFIDGKKTEIGNDPASFQKVLDKAIAQKASKSTKQ